MITTDPFSILAEQKRFYQELYESRNNNNTEGMPTIEACITLSQISPRAFQLPDDFQKLSGLGVNRIKTEGM